MLVDATVGVAYPLIGALILVGQAGARRPPLAWVLLGAGLASGARGALTTAAGARRRPATGRPVGVSAQLQSCLWVPGFLPLLTLVPLLYPDGLLPGPALAVRRAGVRAWASCLLTVGLALYPEAFVGESR